MKERIPLQVVEGRLTLVSVIECRSLRVQRQIMKFVIDTGSPDSYISDRDVRRLQIHLKGKGSAGEVDLGGSRFRKIGLPKLDMYLLKEGSLAEYMSLRHSFCALQTTKSSQKKIAIAQTIPSILGMDFLRENKVSLHVILTEDMAFLEYGG